jgi:hypothetical protein
MGVGFFILVGVRFLGSDTQASSFPDDGLINFFPKTLGPHERLVIEASHEHGRGNRIQGTDIKLKGRPTILAFGN